MSEELESIEGLVEDAKTMKEQAEIIRNEQEAGANTAERVGGLFSEIVDAVEEQFEEVDEVVKKANAATLRADSAADNAEQTEIKVKDDVAKFLENEGKNIREAIEVVQKTGSAIKAIGDEAKENGDYAKRQGDRAETAIGEAFKKADYAGDMGGYAETKADLADAKANLANEKAQLADQKATLANNAALTANKQAACAKDAEEAALAATAKAEKVNAEVVGNVVTITDRNGQSKSVDLLNVVDNLTTEDPIKPLSANQGKVLDGRIDELDKDKASSIEVSKKADKATTYSKDEVDGKVDECVKIVNLAYHANGEPIMENVYIAFADGMQANHSFYNVENGIRIDCFWHTEQRGGILYSITIQRVLRGFLFTSEGNAVLRSADLVNPIDEIDGRNAEDWLNYIILNSNDFGIPDAPKDGKTYGRKDGEWVENAGGGSLDVPIAKGEGQGSVIENNIILEGFTSGRYINKAGFYAHAEGVGNKASGASAHAEGQRNTASGGCSHAEGLTNTASGDSSHAEGNNTTASGKGSHAEGDGTTASGKGSHAEGYYTTASGDSSHAEGDGTTASGKGSHAEGNNTTASGDYSRASGFGNNSTGYAESTFGRFNASNPNNKINITIADSTIFNIGVGGNPSDRKNALDVHCNGGVFVYGIGGWNGTYPMGEDVKSLQDVVGSYNAIIQNLSTTIQRLEKRVSALEQGGGDVSVSDFSRDFNNDFGA